MDMKRDYYEDVKVFTSGVIVFWLGVLILALAVFPFVAKNNYLLNYCDKTLYPDDYTITFSFIKPRLT